MKNNIILFDFLCSNSLRRFANKNFCTEKNTITVKNIHKRWIRMPLMVLVFLFGSVNVSAQTTVTYTMQTGNFNSLQTERNNNPPFSGTYNNGATQLAQYANGGSFGNTPGAAAFQTFSSTGAGSGAARTLRVGDRFTITVFTASNPSAGGRIGISFRNTTSVTNFFSSTDASTVARFQLDNTGGWKIYNGGTTIENTSATSNTDRTLSIEITSSNTFNATIAGTTYYDLSFAAAGPIAQFCIYTFGDSNPNSFWKNASLTNFGHSAGDGLRFGYGLSGSSSSSISGIVSDGINTNSTGTAVVNVVRVGGASGTSVTLSGTNTFTGLTTVNANGTLRLGVSSTASSSGPLGTTGAGTTITSGGVLNMNGFSLTSAATEALTINGTGISSGGSLINSTGTPSTWIGTVALGSDASVGGSGNTTLSGVVSGANSLTKVGTGTVTLSNTNTFGGASKSLTIAQGTVAINSFTNALGNSLNTFTLGTSSTSGTLSTTSGTGNVSRSFSVALGGGTLEIAGSGTPTFLTSAGTYTGTLNGEFTVNCSSTGGAQFNLGLSGAGGMTINSSGSGVVTMGASGAAAATYSGDTKITAGTLELGLANMLPNSSKLVLNGGTFSTGATAGFAETVGTLQLTENSTILLGTGSHTINFSASNSVAWTAGKTLTITGWTGTASGGTAGRIYVGSSGSGLTQAQLDAINFTSQQPGAQIISGTGEIVPNFTVTITSAQSGDWNSTSTWVGGVVPANIDNVVIASTHTVTVSASASCKKVSFTGTGGILSVGGGQQLSVSSSVEVEQSASQNNAGTISGGGTLTCATVGIGTTSPVGAAATRTATLTSSINALTCSGTITLTARITNSNNINPIFNIQSGTVTTTDITTVHPVVSPVTAATVSLASGAGTGTLKLTGTTPFTIDTDGTNTITLNGTGATVEYAASGAQTVRNTSYTNLTLSGSGNKTLAAFGISATLSVQGSAVGITTAPTFGASSTLEYKNAGNRTTTAIEWPSSSGPSNIIIDNSGSTITMLASAARTLSGNVTLTAGTLADAGNTLTVQGNIAGTATHTGAGSITMTGASKTISGATLTNLTLNNASGFSLIGSPTINGALTFTSGRLSIGSNTLILAGTVASMTTANNITGSSTSNLSITGTGTLGTLLFNQTTAGTTNILNNLTINRASTGIVNLGSALNLAGNLSVTNGSLRSSGANVLTMAGTTQSFTISNATGGSVLGVENGSGNDLTLAIANGSTTTLTGDATSTSDDDKKFFNVTVNTGGTLALSRGILCKFGTFTINGTLQINANGYVQSTPTSGTSIAPTYGSSSLLKYNSAGTYGRGLEWSTTSGAGYPNNVQVSNNTTLNVRNGSDVARQIAGNLIVDSGSTLSLEGMTIVSPTDIGLTVAGNVINNGSITLASSTERLKCVDFSNNTGATTTLSSNVGGDLELTGSLIDNATFNSNNRAVFFTGSGVQDVSGTGTFNIDYIVSNKTSGSIRMLTNLLVEGPNGGNAITLTNSSDILNLNGFSLTLGKASVASTISGNGFILGSSASSISIFGTGALGIIRFDQTTPGTTNALNNLTINRTTSGTVVLGNAIAVSNALTITNGNLHLGTAIHTAGSLSLGGATQTTASSYGGTGSPAGNINTTYFAATTGVVNTGSCATYSLTSTTVSSPVCSSGASITLASSTTSNLPIGTYTVYYTLTGVNTGSFNTSMTVSAAGSGTFTTGSLSSGSTTITVNYLRNGCVSAISGSTATFTVNNVSSAAVISGTNSICSGSTNLSVAITGGSSPFTVIYTDGTSNFTVNSYTSGSAIPVSPATTTTYSLVSVTSTGGCVGTGNSGSAIITVNNASTAAVISGSTTACAGSTNNLQVTITGGTSPFTVVYTNGTSNFTLNNYTSSNAIPVSPSTTTTYSLVSVTSTGGCVGTGNSGSAVVTVGTSCTWNGTAWSPSEPTSISTVEFTGNYTASSNLSFCSVVVTSGIVTIPSGFNITLNGSISATGGSFVVENNANLIQNTNVSNSGSIIVKRNTSPLMRQDYVMWASPVSEQQLQAFSPQTLSNRFYTYNPSTNLYVAETATNNFTTGKGYLIRLPNNHPTSPTIWNGQFSGVPNNGTISLSLTSGTYNAIGNPYPSAINAGTFIINNSLTDALYFWRKTNNATTSSYATYTLAGGVSNSGGDPLGLVPNGFISVGQGFIAKVPSGGNSLSFTNSMRVGNNSNQFLRSSLFERSRYWLNLTNQTGFFGQIMVAYMTGATNGYDPAIDGLYINDSQTALTSLVDNQEYVIQARALPFLSTDVVALGFKSELAGTYTISLNNFDGLIFETNNQAIYLKDNLTNTIQDLRAGSYTFDTEAGVFNSRFEVSYESLLAIENPSLSSNTLAVYKHNQEIVVNAGKTNLSKVEVYDILGRLLVEKHNINGSEVRLNAASTNQVILVKVTSAANEVVTKRIIN